MANSAVVELREMNVAHPQCDNVCRVFESSFVSKSDFQIFLRMRSGLMGGCGQF